MLEAARAALERQSGELEAALRALADQDTAAAQKVADANAVVLGSEDSRPLRTGFAAAEDSAAKEAEALRRALEGQTAQLDAARRALTERDAAAGATAAEAAAALAAAVAAAEIAASERTAAVQARQVAASAAMATVDGLACLQLALEQWEVVELAAGHLWEGREMTPKEAGESQRQMVIPPLSEHSKLVQSEQAMSDSQMHSSPSEDEGCKKLQAQIELFLNRQDEACVGRAFTKYSDEARKLILPTRLHEALAEFGVHLPLEEATMLMTTMDVHNNGGLDLQEFTSALRQPTSPVEQFVATLPISGMLASSLAIPGAAEPLKELCTLDSDRLNAGIEAFSLSLHQVLKVRLAKLKILLDSKEAKDQEDSDGSGAKCAVFVMNAGSVKAYHEGMYERIGEHTLPQMPLFTW